MNTWGATSFSVLLKAQSLKPYSHFWVFLGCLSRHMLHRFLFVVSGILGTSCCKGNIPAKHVKHVA